MDADAADTARRAALELIFLSEGAGSTRPLCSRGFFLVKNQRGSCSEEKRNKMENLNLNKTHVIRGANLSDAKPFGEQRDIRPEGAYATFIKDCGWKQTNAASQGQNSDIMLVFQLESREPGFEGLELIERIWFPNGQITPVAGMDDKMLKNLKMARDKVFTALLSVGYTEAQLAQATNLDIQPALFTNGPLKGGKIVKLFHKLEETNDPQTNVAVYLKTGARKHHVNEEVISADYADYAAGKLIKPNRAAKSAAQQAAEQENAIGVAAPGSVQPNQGFQPGGAPVQSPFAAGGMPGAPVTVAQPAPGAVMAGTPGGNPFGPQTVPAGAPVQAQPFGGAPAAGGFPGGIPNGGAAAVPPGFAPPPNGAAPGGLGSALPPR